DHFTLSPDGRLLAARVDEAHLGLWKLPEGQRLEPLDMPLGLWETYAFSHDAHWLAVGSSPATAGSVWLWDLDTRQSRKMPVNETTGILSVAFAPDGKTLVVVTYDETVSFWNLPTLEEIMREDNFAGNFGSAIFSPNGEHLALPLGLRHAPSFAEIEAKERA